MICFPWLKRLGDVVLAVTALVLLMPVLAAVWVAVRVVMGRPVFFQDLRAGKDGRPICPLRQMRQKLPRNGLGIDDDAISQGSEGFKAPMMTRSPRRGSIFRMRCRNEIMHQGDEFYALPPQSLNRAWAISPGMRHKKINILMRCAQ